MTTPHRYEEYGPEDANEVVDVADLVESLAQMAREHQGQAQPIAAGTFVMYPMVDGGVMFVTSVDSGPFAGIKHSRIPPAMIRAVTALAGGGTKLDAFKALTGLGKRKAIRGGV
jgi:hypothetical protein